MITEFIARFTPESLIDEERVYQIGDEWFFVPAGLFAVGKNVPRKPVFAGTLLGKKKNNYLVPGVALLDLLAGSKNTKKVIVTDKAAWLFVCAKNLLHGSVVSSENAPQPNDWVLVMNNNECLGFGQLMTPLSDEKGAITNVFDIGDFLRRERART
jgi:ribosome biogenesis protein Nip4